MTRSERMRPVRKIADDKAEAAAKAYAALQQRLQEQQARLQQLEEFRAQYQEQRIRSGAAGIDGFRLRDYNAFVGRIDAAIRQQQHEVEQLSAAVEQKRQQWLALLSKAKAIDKVVQRYAEAERQEVQRREQQQNDAMALRRRHKLPDD